MDRCEDTSYNERLFSGGLRRRLHLARYYWVASSIARLQSRCDRVLELGCYDGKLLEFLPGVSRYVGLDANWEGGLDIAADRWRERPEYEFRFCQHPDQMDVADETFDCSFAMETLEHVPPDLVDPYLAQLARVTQQYLFVTVPNEIGAVFLAKHLTKRLRGGDYQAYTHRELWYALLGKTEHVTRHEHKGFHYGSLRDQIAAHFDIVEFSGHPLTLLPPWFNFGVGIIARSRSAPHFTAP